MTWLARSLTAFALMCAGTATGCDSNDELYDEASSETDASEETGDAQPEDPDEPADEDPNDGDPSDEDPNGRQVEHLDLASCEFQLSCPAFWAHLGPEGDPTCARTLAGSNSTGVLAYTVAAGPDFYEQVTLSILLGDGTAVVQDRTRHCVSTLDDVCEPSEVPWDDPPPHRVCDLFDSRAEAEACSDPESEDCGFYPRGYSNCTEVEDFTCQELRAILEAS